MSVSTIEAHRLTEGCVMRSHYVLAVLTVVFEVLPERRGGVPFFFASMQTIFATVSFEVMPASYGLKSHPRPSSWPHNFPCFLSGLSGLPQASVSSSVKRAVTVGPNSEALSLTLHLVGLGHSQKGAAYWNNNIICWDTLGTQDCMWVDELAATDQPGATQLCFYDTRTGRSLETEWIFTTKSQGTMGNEWGISLGT